MKDLKKIYAIRLGPVGHERVKENHQEFEKNANGCKPLKDFHVSLSAAKATKLFELTRSQMTWYYEGRELASAFVSFFLFFLFLF